MKIYEVLYIWSYDDNDGFDTAHYYSYEDALKDFKERIKDEKTKNLGWASEAFDCNGEVDEKEYQFFTNFDTSDKTAELYWCLYSNENSKNYSQIYLKIFEEKPSKQAVYMVKFDWSTEDDDDIEIELFHSYADAEHRFNELIAQEKDPELSWVGEEAVTRDGKAKCGYMLSTRYGDENSYSYWKVVNKDNYYKHSFIYLSREEIK